jgi:hypothetical protein
MTFALSMLRVKGSPSLKKIIDQYTRPDIPLASQQRLSMKTHPT